MKELYPASLNILVFFTHTSNIGGNIPLRAKNFIEINEGFEVDESSEFLAEVIGGCYEGH